MGSAGFTEMFVASTILEEIKRTSPIIQLVAELDGVYIDIFESKACNMLTQNNKLRKHVLDWISSHPEKTIIKTIVFDC